MRRGAPVGSLCGEAQGSHGDIIAAAFIAQQIAPAAYLQRLALW